MCPAEASSAAAGGCAYGQVVQNHALRRDKLGGGGDGVMSDPSSRFLLLETSGRVGLVALAEGSELRAWRHLDETRRHARDLAPAVAELLRAQGWKARDLSAVIVGRGPGSYTGLRVGLMSAKTLAFATGCALIGIDTFAAIARQAPEECARVDVIADAQKDLVYVQSFLRAGEEWRAESELAIRPFAEWVAGRRGDAWVSGPGLVKWRAKMSAEVPYVAEEAWNPTVESLLVLGLARYRSGEHDDVFALEPLYLRASSAEEQWRGRGESRTD
jgi:tRNA threonylcarbamoyladenosine biosynthesis protein TsaB